ncbi:hypothetical protein [Bacillus cereus]|uniref:hypothetical protein n=1 Tax=Bacillus cereus TaxID=1396 RepID=UPI0005CF35A4|nr:hypothetical protein [Bacillus cereus]
MDPGTLGWHERIRKLDYNESLYSTAEIHITTYIPSDLNNIAMTHFAYIIYASRESPHFGHLLTKEGVFCFHSMLGTLEAYNKLFLA